MQNNEFSLQFSKIEQLLRSIYNQQDIMLQYLAGNQPAVNLENRTSTHSPSPGTEKITLTVGELQQRLGISKPEAYELVHQDGFPLFSGGTENTDFQIMPGGMDCPADDDDNRERSSING